MTPMRRSALELGVGLAVFVCLSWVPLRDESATHDEVAHLGAAYSYGVTGDYRLNPEHPALGKLFASIPFVFMEIQWPKDLKAWASGDQWAFGYSLLYESGNDPDRLLRAARLSMLFWGLLLIASVFVVSSSLFGPQAGRITLAIASFCPTLLAHAHLVTTDVIVTTLLFLSLAFFDRVLRAPTHLATVATGVLAGGALASKYSAIVLLPVMGWLSLLAAWRNRSTMSRGDRIRFVGRLAALGVVALTVVWAAYGFRYAASPGGQGSAGFRLHLLPEAWARGYSTAQSHVLSGQGAFALGRISHTGWWWYFPFAFLVKVPVTTLVLFGGGLWAAVRRAWGGRPMEDFLVAPLLVFGVLATSSHLNLGIRHILPIFPPLMVLAGGVAEGASRRVRWGALALAGGTALSTLAAAPYFLAYFNEPALLAADREEMLVDSNLDWGQDLARLKRYVDRHGIPEVKLAYFGTASPRSLGLRIRNVPGPNVYGSREPEWPRVTEFQAGDVVAISATYLMFRENSLLLPFLKLKPIDRIGHSILLYRLDRDLP